MLKDQLLALAILIPFLAAPLAGGPAKTGPAKTGPAKTTVASPQKAVVPGLSASHQATATPGASAPVKGDDKNPLLAKGTTPPDTGAKPVDTGKTDPKIAPKTDPAKKADPTPKPADKNPIQIPLIAPPFQEITVGAGAKLAPAERAVVHFIIADSSGKELMNSKKRGLPLTLELKPETPSFWNALLKDMKVGGARKMTLAPSEVNGGKGLPPYIPAGIEISITVWLLKTSK
jgi:hypothetical protein